MKSSEENKMQSWLREREREREREWGVYAYHAYRCTYNTETFAVERCTARYEPCWDKNLAC